MKNFIKTNLLLLCITCASTPLIAVMGEEEYMMSAEESFEPSGVKEEGYMQFQEETDQEELPTSENEKLPIRESEQETSFEEIDM